MENLYHFLLSFLDDVLRDIKSHQIDNKLIEINRLHPSLKFTVERETDSSIPFLDMKIHRRNGKLTSAWFTKTQDWPWIFTRSPRWDTRDRLSPGWFIEFITRAACGSYFMIVCEKAKKILENNQYPKTFYEPIISRTITRIIENHKKPTENAEKEEEKW